MKKNNQTLKETFSVIYNLEQEYIKAWTKKGLPIKINNYDRAIC